MKPASVVSQKMVTPENLEGLAAGRLAQILADVAETLVDLKRRLRMALATGMGPEHVVPEIDGRLATIEK